MRLFFEPEIDHFVMTITSAEARVWHIASYQIELAPVAVVLIG